VDFLIFYSISQSRLTIDNVLNGWPALTTNVAKKE